MANQINNMVHALKQQMRAIQLQNNNLANANTTGFKEDHVDFKRLMTDGAQGAEVTSAYKTFYDMKQGNIQTTGRDLDLAFNGKGFLAVQGMQGDEVYTRAGSLQISQDRFLTDVSGRYVLGENGPIAVPAARRIMISEHGVVSILPANESGNKMEEIGRIKLVSPPLSQLTKGEDGYFHMQGGGNAAIDNSIVLTPGALEASNVNPVDSMVELIQSSRDFEQYIKVIKTLGDNDERSSQILRLQG